jgi:hypothetical protein
MRRKPAPPVTVLRDRYVPSPKPDGEGQGLGDVQALTLSQALRREWDTDAHFTAYEALHIPCEGVPEGELPVRLDSDAIKEGLVVRMHYLVADLDGPDHIATEEWRAESEKRLEASGLAWYRTRGGARVVQRLPDGGFEIDSLEEVRGWTEFHSGWCEWLRQAHGLDPDPLSDWTRLYRLPNVMRDGEPQRARVQGRITRWRPEGQWCEPPAHSRERREAPEGRADVHAPERTGDPGRDAIFGALLGALGSWEDYPGRKHAICGAVGGVMRRTGFTRGDCATFIRTWLPEAEPGVDVEHGAQWACQAWDREPHEVSGVDTLAEHIGDRSAQAFAHGATLRYSIRRSVELSESGAYHSPAEAALAGGEDPLGEPCDVTGDDEPMGYLCEGLRLAPSQGKISVLAGAPGGGKGPIADHLAVAFALGEKAFGEFQCQQTKVLLLDCEGVRLTKRRLRRLTRGMGRLPAELAGQLTVYDTSAKDLVSEDYLEALRAHVVASGVEVVILDSYTSAMLTSGIDANSPQFALLAKMLGSLGVLVLAVAHANKNAGDGPPRLGDVAYSGAFAAMAQTAIVVHYPDPEDRESIQVGCARAPETGFAPFEVRFRDVDRDALSVAVRRRVPAEDNAERSLRDAIAVGKRADRIEGAVRRLDKGMGVQLSSVRAASGINGAKWADAYAECVRRGSIAEDAMPNRTRVLIRLASDVKATRKRLPRPGEVAS